MYLSDLFDWHEVFGRPKNDGPIPIDALKLKSDALAAERAALYSTGYEPYIQQLDAYHAHTDALLDFYSKAVQRAPDHEALKGTLDFIVSRFPTEQLHRSASAYTDIPVEIATLVLQSAKCLPADAQTFYAKTLTAAQIEHGGFAHGTGGAIGIYNKMTKAAGENSEAAQIGINEGMPVPQKQQFSLGFMGGEPLLR